MGVQTHSRLWRKKITDFRYKIRNSAYPGHIESIWIIIAVTIGLHFSGRNYGLMKYLTGFTLIAELVPIIAVLEKKNKINELFR